MGYLEPKMSRPYNSGSDLRNVLQFCTMKGAKKVRNYIIVFSEKKNLIRGNLVGHFDSKMVRSHNFESVCSQVFFILHNKFY